jgi:predicted nucleotidyltransferase
MIECLEARRAEISALCRRFNVRRLDLFGSAVRGTDFTKNSDFDFLVAYADDYPPALSEFFALRDALSTLLGRPVDLTMESALRNPYLRAAIEESRQLVHGA